MDLLHKSEYLVVAIRPLHHHVEDDKGRELVTQAERPHRVLQLVIRLPKQLEKLKTDLQELLVGGREHKALRIVIDHGRIELVPAGAHAIDHLVDDPDGAKLVSQGGKGLVRCHRLARARKHQRGPDLGVKVGRELGPRHVIDTHAVHRAVRHEQLLVTPVVGTQAKVIGKLPIRDGLTDVVVDRRRGLWCCCPWRRGLWHCKSPFVVVSRAPDYRPS